MVIDTGSCSPTTSGSANVPHPWFWLTLLKRMHFPVVEHMSRKKKLPRLSAKNDLRQQVWEIPLLVSVNSSKLADPLVWLGARQAYMPAHLCLFISGFKSMVRLKYKSLNDLGPKYQKHCFIFLQNSPGFKMSRKDLVGGSRNQRTWDSRLWNPLPPGVA